MPGKHSKYSPSASKIWLNCPKAIHLYSSLPQESSAAAREGTLYHDMMEKFLITHGPEAFCKMKYTEFLKLSGFNKDRMSARLFEMTTSFFSDHVLSAPGKPVISYERKLKMDSVIKGCYGTADGVIKAGKILYVFDYKFGYVEVPANSPQLILYAIGAKNLYKNITDICLVIFQPKRSGHYKICNFTRAGLEKLEKQYHRQAKRILAKTPRAILGDHCEEYAKCRPYCEKYQKNRNKKAADIFKAAGY